MTKLQKIAKSIARRVDDITYISIRHVSNSLEFNIITVSPDFSDLEQNKIIRCSRKKAEQIFKKFLRQTKSLGFGIIESLISDDEDPTLEYMCMARISDISSIVRDNDTVTRSYYGSPCVKIFFNRNKYGYGERWIFIADNRCLRKTLLSHKRYDLLLML